MVIQDSVWKANTHFRGQATYALFKLGAILVGQPAITRE